MLLKILFFWIETEFWCYKIDPALEMSHLPGITFGHQI